MKESNGQSLLFSSANQRRVEADFEGGAVSSDGGLLLMREADRRTGLIDRIAAHVKDARQPGKVLHEVAEMIRQRTFGVIAGWDDLNDAESLRHDPVHQIACGSDKELASASTLCRFENRQQREMAWAVNRELVEQFIRSKQKAPASVILDFDGTDTPIHGNQEGKFFHGYYDCHCFLPLYVFCGDSLLCAYLRRSNIDVAKHAAAILKLLVLRIRQAWPRTKIVFRGDSGFCRNLILDWCDRHDVKYVVGIAKNSRLLDLAAMSMSRAKQEFEKTHKKQRVFTAFDYAADKWTWVRWVIAKAEHSENGENPRFIVTNIVGDSQRIYDRRYCARGEMENRIKEQMMLFADRVSAHRWWANQWRILLSAIAYTLMETVRTVALAGTVLAQATCATIRTKLIKIGAVIVSKLTVVRIHLSSHYPLRDLYAQVLSRLVPI